jgi:alkanesulfonate monooxygenase SsuD/methylene tetrahydromethanopterin reductase-like flavin-dependent oxidoreductase (luciferase family)
LQYWQWLARTAEKGKFTSIFIADGYATLDVYGGNADAQYKGGANIGAMDPLVIVPAMAAVTESIAFGVTASTSYIGKLTNSSKHSPC